MVSVSDVTGHPEIFDGRVKTLHPAIHGALLARLEQEEDRQAQEQMADELREANMSEAQISYFQRVQRLFGHFC